MATEAEWRASYEAKIDDLRRETLRATTARALAARLWHILEVEATDAAVSLALNRDFAPPEELEIWDGFDKQIAVGGDVWVTEFGGYGVEWEIQERVSALVHEAWMESKRAQGVESRQSESGEELMVPYAELSEAAKDLDRGTVRAVLAAIEADGLVLVRLGGDPR